MTDLPYILIGNCIATKSLLSDAAINKQNVIYTRVQIDNACDATISYFSIVMFKILISLFFRRIAHRTN